MTVRDNRVGYNKPSIPPKVTATCNLLNHTPIYSTSHFASIVDYHHLSSQRMSTKGSPPKTANMAPPGGLLASEERDDDNSESSDNSLRTAPGKDSQLGEHTNQCHPPQAYGYPLAQQPFPGTPQFYRHSPFNMTPSSQQTTSARQGFPTYGPQCPRYDVHQGGYCGSQMFPPSADSRIRAVNSRCTEGAFGTAGRQSSPSADIFQLSSSIWTSFRHTWQTAN